MSRRRCFVISPIGPAGSDIRRHADAVLEFIIDKATEDLDIETIRSDRILDSGSISKRMFDEILASDLCVAILTGHNPNVFYELAVAQSAARPVVILIEKGQQLPFDVQDLRCVEYDLGDVCELVAGKYARRLEKHLKTIRRQGWMASGLFELYGYGRQERFEQQLRAMAEDARPEPLDVGVDAIYKVPGRDRHVVLVTGDVVKLAGLQTELRDHRRLRAELHDRRRHRVDTIVSLEDVNLQLPRYFEAVIPGAISGTLRFMDARKSRAGKVLEDSLAENLRRASARERIKPPAPQGSVIATPATQLRKLGIRYIFHVAALTGSVGDGYIMMNDLIDDCVRNVFRRFDQLAKSSRWSVWGRSHRPHTLLFPMLGAAATHLEPEEIAYRMLKPIVHQMRQFKRCRQTYLLAWLEFHRIAIRRAARELAEKEKVLELVWESPKKAGRRR